MKTKVWGLGLSRTGTTTLNHALVNIGWNTIHYAGFNKMIHPYHDGATDIPVLCYMRQLDEMFPGSKFIWTDRDRDEWISRIVPYFENKRQNKMDPWSSWVRTTVFGTLFPHEDQAATVYDKHNAFITQYFANRKNDLLKINIPDGESPETLYDFLDVDKARLPTTFLHKNKNGTTTG